MAGKLHGVIRGGAIELDDPVDLPDGTKVEITIVEESYTEAWKRQRDLMKQGFPMGRRQSIQRGRLYERGWS
jgi:predicted DNA-binding antitoxin AbrB/MazE fold protein